MIKLGIVTITELDNFGNRLQNYALQTVLQNMGCEVETIPNYIAYKYRKNVIYKIMQIIINIIKPGSNRLAKLYKQHRFEKFDKKYFKFSKYYSTIDYIAPELAKEYDFCIAGSDQIWNPNFLFNFDFNFLSFIEKDKRIAYSASFGVDDLPNKFEDSFKNWINGIPSISVREFEGKYIIKNLTGRDVQVLVDPSLLLTRQDWTDIEQKPKWICNQKYMLLYLLGNDDLLDEKLKQLYEKYPKYKDYQIIDINNFKKLREFSITPDEFIWLIDHSEIMITDSFHGTVFSILMKTPFLYMDRIDNNIPMSSRIKSLFRLLGINNNDIIYTEHINKYSHIETNIENERIKAYKFLRSALRI